MKTKSFFLLLASLSFLTPNAFAQETIEYKNPDIEKQKIISASEAFDMPAEIIEMATTRLRPFLKKLQTGSGEGNYVQGSVIFNGKGVNTTLTLYYLNPFLNAGFNFEVLNILSPIVKKDYLGKNYYGKSIFEKSIFNVILKKNRLEQTVTTTYNTTFEYEPEIEAEEHLKSTGKKLPFEEGVDIHKKEVLKQSLEIIENELHFRMQRIYYIRAAGSQKWHIDKSTFDAVKNSQTDFLHIYEILSGKPHSLDEMIQMESDIPEKDKYLSKEEARELINSEYKEQNGSDKLNKLYDFEQLLLDNESVPKSTTSQAPSKNNVFDIAFARKKICKKLFNK